MVQPQIQNGVSGVYKTSCGRTVCLVLPAFLSGLMFVVYSIDQFKKGMEIRLYP